MRRFAIIGALLAVSGAMPAPPPGDAPEPDVDRIRVSADGAGPSHLFWLTGDEAADVVGVVDPLFAAIRFYRIRRAAAPLADRMTALGVCALPVDFRPWRIHGLRGTVVLESMPDPGALGHVATPGALRTRKLAVRRDLLAAPARFDAAARAIDTRGWDPATAPACGRAGPLGPIGAGTRVRAHRLSQRAIRLDDRHGSLTVRSRVNRLLSARAIESGAGLRIVEASEALPSQDGVVRVRSRLLAYAKSGRLRRAIALRDSELRGKFGLKPVAVLPTGELLVMGKQPGSASPFRIRSCGLITGPLDASLCGEDPAPAPAPRPREAAQPARIRAPTPSGTLRARTIFANVAAIANYRLTVDTSGLPGACRLAEGCRVGGSSDRFVPIRGIRLTRGSFTRRGVPYAQARVPEDVDRLLASTPAQLARALAGVRRGTRGWPGNLADGLDGDLGIDCSGLVQIAWGGRGGARLDTRALQGLASPLACSGRLPGPEYLRPGDAIGINVGAPGAHIANHVMLFAAAMRLDGANDVWMMLESSSGCDGVCWSFYDPSLFDGWGLYRANGRGDAACIAGNGASFTPIPYDLTRWTALVARR